MAKGYTEFITKKLYEKHWIQNITSYSNVKNWNILCYKFIIFCLSDGYLVP